MGVRIKDKVKEDQIGDEVTQESSRHVGNEFDDIFDKKVEDAGIKIEMNGRYVDDNNIFARSIGRELKFCPMAGCLVEKSEDEVKECENRTEDEITMEELRKVADECIGMLTTEADSTSKHPELGYKVPILDRAVWVEDGRLPAPGMESKHDELHSRFEKSQECLPLRPVDDDVYLEPSRLEAREESARRMVPQVMYNFFRKPMAPQ